MENNISYSKASQNILLVALSASEAGIALLSDVQEHLRFASDELKRMEDESGTPLSDEQTARAAAYFRASQRIKKLLLVTRRMPLSMAVSQPPATTH